MKLLRKKEHQLSPDALADFCRDAGSLLRRGHSLGECFAAMARSAGAPAEEQLYLQLRREVRTGSFAAAMESTGAFPSYMIDVITRGEQANRTEEALGTLAIYFERERTAENSLRGHAGYPAVMAALTMGILIVAAGFVLPLFADQFAALGLSFSPFARHAMQIGRWLAGLAGVLLVAATFFGLLLWLMLQTSSLPAFQRGLTAQRIAAGRFVAALALLCRAGFDDRAALIDAAAMVGHPEIIAAAARMKPRFDEGLTLPQALAASGLIAGPALDRLRADGRAAFLLDEAAARLAAETAARIDRLLARLEPVIVLALSTAAGAILLSVMLPLLGGLAAMG